MARGIEGARGRNSVLMKGGMQTIEVNKESQFTKYSREEVHINMQGACVGARCSYGLGWEC